MFTAATQPARLFGSICLLCAFSLSSTRYAGAQAEQQASWAPLGAAIVRGESLVLSAPMSGTIEEVNVKLDDLVQADQRLVRFQSREVELALKQAEVEVQRALAAVDRGKTLVSQAKSTVAHRREDLRRTEQLGSSVSEAELRRGKEALENAEVAHMVAYQDYQQASQLVAAAELRREQAALLLSRQEVLAPTNGQLVRLNVIPGERIELGHPLLELRLMEHLHCDFEVAEEATDTRGFVGRAVIAKFTTGGQQHKLLGEVASIGGEVNARGMVTVRVQLRNQLSDTRWLLSHGKQVELFLAD